MLPRSGKAPTDLAKRLEDVLDVKATAARIRGSFLRKVGIISLQGGICRLSIWTERWHETGDARIIAALLHSRCQFVGELLEVAREPKTSEELLAAANGTYGMGWDTQTQVANRRGWLQSTGMVEATVEGKIVTTPSGRAFAEGTGLVRAGDNAAGTVGTAPTPAAVVLATADLAPTPAPLDLDVIVDAILESATDGRNPDRFGQAVRDAFALLGFQGRMAWRFRQNRQGRLLPCDR